MEGLGEKKVQERAHLMSLRLPQAGSWLTVAPILALFTFAPRSLSWRPGFV